MRHRRASLTLTAVVVIGMVLAACGGGGKKSGSTATTADVGTETTTTLGDTSTTLTDGGTTTSVATGGSTTTTSTKSTTKTTARTQSGLTKATAAPQSVGGIAQVTTTASTAPAEPPQPGGSLNVLLAAEGNGFDPTFSTGSIGGTDPLKLFAVYDALVYQDSASGSIIPQTAESMTTQDAITWTLKVRPNLKFTDNTAYNADAVKFNWERCLDAALAPPCSNAAMLKTWGLDFVDPLTLRIKLPAANGQLPRIISIGSGALSAIASPTALKAAGSRDAYLQQKPVGAGPFVLKEWIRDSKMTLTRNPSYWNSPRPYLDELVFKPVVDDSQRVNSFKAGEADAMFITNPVFIGDLQKSYPVASVPSINSSIYLFNVAKAPFNDVNLRRAVELAIDRDSINKTIFGGVLETANSYFPMTYGFSDPTIQLPAVDLPKAQQLVNDWISSKNGGKPLVFTWSSGNSPQQTQLAQLVQQQVQKLNNVTVNLKLQSTVQHTNDLRTSNFEVGGTVWTGADPEPQVYATLRTGGGRGAILQGYSNTTLDKYLDDSRAAVDAKSRNDALKNAQKEAMKDVPILVINRSPFFWPYKSNLKDVAFFDEGGLLSDRLWIKSRG